MSCALWRSAARGVAVLCALATGVGAQDLPRELACALTGVDVDGDGHAELESLVVLGEAGRATAPAVVVFVESRLLELDRDGALRDRLARHARDLAAEGYHAVVFAARVQAGRAHQDGRTLLALRRVLQEWHDAAPLAGAILVGHFPDALLVRTCNWRREGPIDVAGQHFGDGVPFLRRVAEIVAHRCDLVLADLDGRWNERYVAPATDLTTVHAVFPSGVPADGGAAAAVGTGGVRYSDFFHVDDGRVTVAGDTIVIDDALRDEECSEADRRAPNVIAQPDIAVSRIDARGVAWSPRREIGGVPLFDVDGRPTTATLPAESPVPDWCDDLWQPDPVLEVRLLVEYFDRNHRFRTTPAGDSFRPASISHGLGSGFGELKRATTAWQDFDAPGYDARRDPTLVTFVDWLALPAVLRTLRAHSDERISVFARTDLHALNERLGGAPLCWRVKDHELAPSLAPATGNDRAGFFLLRTIHDRGLCADQPYLMIHTGCEAMSPPEAKRAFDDPRYGAFPNAESLLFLTPCVALVGRAKVFYDEPRDFCAALGEGATFGDAWRRYFAVEAAAASWGAVGGDIGRKRSYFWSVVGDWTLRLPRS